MHIDSLGTERRHSNPAVWPCQWFLASLCPVCPEPQSSTGLSGSCHQRCKPGAPIQNSHVLQGQLYCRSVLGQNHAGLRLVMGACNKVQTCYSLYDYHFVICHVHATILAQNKNEKLPDLNIATQSGYSKLPDVDKSQSCTCHGFMLKGNYRKTYYMIKSHRGTLIISSCIRYATQHKTCHRM